MNSDLKGQELLDAYVNSGLQQKEHANSIGMEWSTYKSRLWRAQQEREIQEDIVDPPPPLETKAYPPMYFRAAVFDIETTDFKAGGDQNFLCCVSVLPLDTGEVKTLRLNFSDGRDDRQLLQEVIGELCKYDILIGHNIIAYDFNWLLTRLIYHGMPSPPKRWLYYDTYYAAKRVALKSWKSLGALIDFFHIDGVKTKIMEVHWKMVASDDRNKFRGAMKDIVYHCEQDVLANREVFYALWERDRAAVNLPFTKKW